MSGILANPLLVVLAGIAIVALIFWYAATEIDRRKRNVGTAVVSLVALLCIAAIIPPGEKLKGGIDLIGGSAFTVQVKAGIDDDGSEIPVNPESVGLVKEILGNRLASGGLADNLIQPLGTDRLIIEMPGIAEEDSERVENIIKRTVILEIKEVHPETERLASQVKAKTEVAPAGYKLYELRQMDDKTGTELESTPILLSKRNILTGDQVKYARKSFQGFGVAEVTLTSEGGDRFLNATSRMRPGQDRMAVVLDGKAIVAPVVNGALGSTFVIEGLVGKGEVEEVSAALGNPLKNELVVLSKRKITAKYGEEVVRQGITAAVAGLVLTLVFVLFYYRIAGVVALLGLSVNILILFGAMAMFGATFTLPGIAGIILTIGVAVDANVLIYERLREEMNEGKSVGAALKAAYEKAFSAIFDANITTLLTALILFWRASDQVKGFAITLTIGILASMFAALIATRVFFFWGTDTGVLKKLTFMNLIPNRTIRFLDKRKPAFVLSTVLLIGALLAIGTKRESSLGIDFVGGSILTIQLDEGQDVTPDAVRTALGGLELSKKPYVQEESAAGSDGSLIVVRLGEGDAPKAIEALRSQIPVLGAVNEAPTAEATEPAAPAEPAAADEEKPVSYQVEISEDTIAPSLGGEFLQNSVIALGLGLLVVLIYISLRFEFSFAVGAFVALFHDILICIGVVVAMGTELSLIHVGAFLTIAGYSINDTIVVFDRVRETLQTKRGSVKEIMDLAINATLSRTILTSVTTFVAVLVLYIFGGTALQDFSAAIMAGVIVGTYSSIFIAAPVVYLWSKKRGTNLRQELLDANLDQEFKTES